MDSQINKQITSLISQTDDIAGQVRLENWDVVELMTQDRQIALEYFFRTPIDVKYAESVAKMIRKILDSDHQLVDYIETQKKHAFSQFSTMQKNSKAHKKYQAIVSLDCS